MTGVATTPIREVSWRRRAICALVALTPVVAAAVLANIATTPNIGGWYATLLKPAFNPPNWIFGPVWTSLYALMAYAFYRILAMPDAAAGRMFAIVLFLLQISLNASWSWAFFYAHSPLAGLIVIALMWIVLVNTLVEFVNLDRIAGWALVPYLAWVSFAAILNFAIWQLN